MNLSPLNSMALLRIFSGCTEIITAILIYKSKSIQDALKINVVPAIVGPLILIGVTSIGLISMTSNGIDVKKFTLIMLGAVLILLGTR